MNFNSRNREGYPDPTFNEALYNITKEERQAKRKAERRSDAARRERPPGGRAGRYKKNGAADTAVEGKEMQEDDPGRTESRKTLGEFQADAGQGRRKAKEGSD
ncbi:MAG: hypothetical protein LUH14_05810 [Clostridiaceae bacterium]|nr:hypothetical protein [Clostridiaceae bacterium]